MATQLQLDDIRRAWDARDPELIKFVELLATQPDRQPDKPIREGAMTFARFLREINSYQFRKKTPEEQMHWRIEQLKALEAPDAEVPLSDRLRLHEIILALWHDEGVFARTCLLKIIASVPLTYGPWKAIKRIFKESEAKKDTEIYGAIAARLDMAFAGGGYQITRDTLAYMVRRAWRFLRRAGVAFPVAYADTAADVLAHYTDQTNWHGTWIANHV